MAKLTAAAKQALSMIDLTSLNDDDTDQVIIKLCKKAETKKGKVAAVCVFPAFVKTAKEALDGTDIKIATVTNFPHGSTDIESSLKETEAAIIDGADEIDVVFPYKALMAGDAKIGFELVKQHAEKCRGRALLKVIIESGELKTTELIQQASNISIDAGADFIKTSTGKVPVNATPEAARIMLECIKGADRNVGFKAAGGVRSTEEAAMNLEIAREIMGEDWISKDNFRFGASSLLKSLLETLGGNAQVDTTNSDSGY